MRLACGDEGSEWAWRRTLPSRRAGRRGLRRHSVPLRSQDCRNETMRGAGRQRPDGVRGSNLPWTTGTTADLALPENCERAEAPQRGWRGHVTAEHGRRGRGGGRPRGPRRLPPSGPASGDDVGPGADEVIEAVDRPPERHHALGAHPGRGCGPARTDERHHP